MCEANTKKSFLTLGFRSSLSTGILAGLALNVAQADDAVLIPPAPKAPEVISKPVDDKPTVQKTQKFVFPSPVIRKPNLESKLNLEEKAELPKITPRPKLALAPKVKTVEVKKVKPPKNSKPWTVMIVPAQKMGVPETEQLATASEFHIDNSNGQIVGQNEVNNFRVDNTSEDSDSVLVQPRVSIDHSHEHSSESSECCLNGLNASNYLEVYKSIPFNHAEYLANPSYRHEATMSLLLGQLPTKSIHNHYEASSRFRTGRVRYTPTLPLYNNPNFRWNSFPYRRHLPYFSNARFYNGNYFFTNPYRFSGQWAF